MLNNPITDSFICAKRFLMVKFRGYLFQLPFEFKLESKEL